MAPLISSYRRPSIIEKPPSSISSAISDHTSHTAARTPSPTDDIMVVLEDQVACDAPMPLKLKPSGESDENLTKKKKGMMSNLRASLRRSTSSARGNNDSTSPRNSFRSSGTSIGRSGHGLGLARSGHGIGRSGHGLSRSGHGGISSAAERHLRGSSDRLTDLDPNTTTADIARMVSDEYDAWEAKSGNSKSSKKSDKSNTSNTSSRLGNLRSYRKKPSQFANHSSHPSGYTSGLSSSLLDKNAPLPSNSEHNDSLSENNFFYAPANVTKKSINNRPSIGEISESSEVNDEEGSEYDSHHRSSSIASSHDVMMDMFNSELDSNFNSEALIAKLGDKPSPEELYNVAAVRVNEVIQEASQADRLNFAAIPHFTKTDVLIGKHLGKGSFSDVFEVIATITEDQSNTSQSLKMFNSELDQRMKAKFGGDKAKPQVGNDATLPALPFESGEPRKLSSSATLPQDHRRHSHSVDEGSVGGEEDDSSKDSMKDDLDKLLESKFGGLYDRSASAPPPVDVEEDEAADKFEYKPESSRDRPDKSTEPEPEFTPSAVRPVRNRRQRRMTTDTSLASSMMVSSKPTRSRSRRVTLAMKCLRPLIRANTEQFIIGVEDLAHETIMLSSLDHPNIIKIHGRAGGCVSKSFRLGDGYFILLDRLQDTLDDRILDWRKKFPNSSKNPPGVQQVKVATAIADAMAFLHSKNIVFRDLKPANVGFDERGIVKLFDFGFAVCIDKQTRTASSVLSGKSSDDDLLYDRAGTPRYMAPEVGLDMGYGPPADVYSFSILLWEIFALKKPFAKIKSATEFTKIVFQKGERPKLGKNWQADIKELLEDSWSSYPNERPNMKVTLRILQNLLQKTSASKRDHSQSLRSSVLKRISWDGK
jgi:serine/threonine protein kinase